MTIEELKKERFEKDKLYKKYNVSLTFAQDMTLDNTFINISQSRIDKMFEERTKRRELVELDLMLRKAIGNNSEITLSTTIKSVKTNVKLRYGENLSDLLSFTDTLLEKRQNETDPSVYKSQLDIQAKEELEWGLISGFTEPYSEEEIKKIHEYEMISDKMFGKIKKKWLSVRIKKIVKYFKEEGVFKSEYETISTQEACFLYDILCFKGVIEANVTYIDQDKYQWIKGKMK